jgi:D-alanyl-lipoteichoic acid acyltransferase DltB (MBOAT superfamily)
MDFWWNIFGYNPENPLIFTKLSFWVFWAFVLLGYQQVYGRLQWRNWFLLGVSLFYYYKAGGYFFVLLLCSTLIDYVLGWWIYEAPSRRLKRLGLGLSVCINLGVLAYFKYAYFGVELYNYWMQAELKPINGMAWWSNALFDTQYNIHHIILPVGISFYTFQTISYTVDIYRGKLKPLYRLRDFALYVTFFPQLVAGPIVRAAEFAPQLSSPYQIDREEYGQGIFLIVSGLVKKILIADFIALHFVDRVFERPELYTGFENLMAMYGYALQIYCDFSGYTDIAIGLALLLGFQLPQNFRAPYLAQSPADFWRRWHISLSTWLRDYLYIPLGGNRYGAGRTYLNLMLTMLLGGLWHGANLRFVLWGAWHGLGLCIHRLWRYYFPLAEPLRGLPRFWAGVLTFHFVCLGWLLFRADSLNTVGLMLGQMWHSFGWSTAAEVMGYYREVFALMGLGYLAHILPQNLKADFCRFFTFQPAWVQAIFITLIIIALYQADSAGFQPFIYFQF